MEYAKDEIFQIRYNKNVNRLETNNKGWTSRLYHKIKRHKLLTTMMIVFMMCTLMNIVMMGSFMKILQTMY